MTSSSLLTMPLIIYNLGVEMVYVLCSRLKAQNVPADKSIKVVQDVVTSLFEKRFMLEMQKKQEIAKHLSVRQLFEKLAHSSIMRLNTSSMNKLFDLMLMSFKLQLVRTKFPEEIYQITLNHLNALVEILDKGDPKNNGELIALVKENINYVNNTYGKMSPYEFLGLRQTLLRFFQGKNVKVSIFIQDGMQSNTGVIFLPMNETAPPCVKMPGTIINYKSDGDVTKEYFCSLKLSKGFCAYYQQSNQTNFAPNERINIITTDLGSNVYGSDKKPSGLNKDLSSTITDSKILEDIKNENDRKSSTTGIFKKDSMSYLENDEERKKNIAYVKKEFNDLADLLNVKSDSDNTFKVDLFTGKKKKNITTTAENIVEEEDYIEIEREKDADTLEKVKNMFDDMDFKPQEENPDDDNLLDLMDMAARR